MNIWRAIPYWCIDTVTQWMTSNRLKFNLSKTEFMWCCMSCWLHLIEDVSFTLPDGTINTSTSMRNLSVFHDHALSLKNHVHHLVRACYCQLRHNKSIRLALPTSAAIQLINNLLVLSVDYCNGLHCRAHANLTDHIQQHGLAPAYIARPFL